MNSMQPVPLRRDIPLPGNDTDSLWASDAIAEMIRALDIPYVLLNPGSSFRGLHDSLVNHLGNINPQMLVVLHEEHAVAIAHGYAKVTGKPLAAIVHSNVGLMHASMAIFNAWVDRVPVMVLGATGPVDAAKRRPWIDWMHTAQDQGALVRAFTKWDAQPASVVASYEALLRAKQIALTAPSGPTYVCFDVSLQETRIDAIPPLPNVSRYEVASPAVPGKEDLEKAAELLSSATRPVILMGRVSRSSESWRHRIQLAEKLNAEVLTDLRAGASFPTDHELHAAVPGVFLSPEAATTLRAADVVLSLDWYDLNGTLQQAWRGESVSAKVIQVSLDHYSHRGWSMDHQGLPPVDVFMPVEPDVAVPLLSAACNRRSVATRPSKTVAAKLPALQDGTISIAMVADALRRAAGEQPVTLIRVPLGWSGEMGHFRDPLDYLGMDGGAGIGSGPGMAVGAALALRDTDRLPVLMTGDGDYLMGLTALWTAANAGIPLLTVVCNNCSFFNDELHQERVARDRDRPVQNRWIGQRIGDPDPDLAALARGLGLQGFGPTTNPAMLDEILARAVAAVRAGSTVVVDVRVTPGYSAAMTSGMTRSHEDHEGSQA
ncbi:thiamine pyrophosphate-binding protein [Comamonas sp. lk]|uniref:thiamine pyrophosphate-binding protein n=1 Tax=Comamonas sp. lk TaxID=2201272 RepID=UPI0019691B52|nr:thiamine pyrophosphate-binding protein [Comamonas sp. lk]